MDPATDRPGPQPRWLYIGAGIVVAVAVGLVAFVLLALGFLMYEMKDVMAGF